MMISNNLHNTMAGEIIIPRNLLNNFHQIHFSSAVHFPGFM